MPGNTRKRKLWKKSKKPEHLKDRKTVMSLHTSDNDAAASLFFSPYDVYKTIIK
jgi:hypothetical protein